MEFADIVHIGREFLWVSLLLVTPVVLVSLIVGLVVSIGQTLTSIQEQTLSFAPRIVAVVVLLMCMMNWYLETLKHYTENLFTEMVGLIH